ncbi:hypothetical protein CATMIT_01600, partial [Catenibacterium mitsuokai DSM 15897]
HAGSFSHRPPGEAAGFAVRFGLASIHVDTGAVSRRAERRVDAVGFVRVRVFVGSDRLVARAIARAAVRVAAQPPARYGARPCYRRWPCAFARAFAFIEPGTSREP